MNVLFKIQLFGKLENKKIVYNVVVLFFFFNFLHFHLYNSQAFWKIMLEEMLRKFFILLKSYFIFLRFFLSIAALRNG
jgi:hypothetical protein